MAEIEIPSPAKINLLLAITGRREDGFHSLTSLVAPLEFGDRIAIRAEEGNPSVALSSNSESIPVDERNLAWKAARGFLDRFQIRAAVSVHIDKRIPVGAGLGGGSSNAASTLMGLSQLFGIDDDASIRSLAESLGSDCPLFLDRSPLIMRGRGELLESLEPEAQARLRGRRIALFKPSFGISTAWAYQALAARPDRYADADNAETRLGAWQCGELPLEDLLFNSFSEVAAAKYPAIPLVLDRIRASVGAPCLMSGSGSACFALADAADIERIRSLVGECWGRNAFFQETRIADI